MSRKVAIYARVSTEHEAQLSALENQIQYYDNELAKHPDWELYERYIDEGITGTSVLKRKNFMRMIHDAEQGKFDLIVTREVSRFARNTVDTLQETRKLKKLGVEVYFTEDNIWTFKDEDGELKLTIMATLAQNESKKISQRVKAGQKITFENGVFYGTGNIIGYDKVGKEMVINEEQAKTVRFIFDSFLKGMGSPTIRLELEKKGYLTSTGLKNWHSSQIMKILQNPFYCGTIVYRKSYIPDYLEQKPKKNNGEVDQVIVEGRHTPIISKEDFNKVQEIIKERASFIKERQKVGHGIPKSIWTKKLKCECGSSFNKKVYDKRDEEHKTYCYQCYKQKSRGTVKARLAKGLDISDTCDVPMVAEWKLEAIAYTLFNQIFYDKESLIEIANELLENEICENNNDSELDEYVSCLEKKIQSNKDKLNKLLDIYLNDTIDKESYTNKRNEIEKNINSLLDEVNSLNKKIDKPKISVKDRIKNLKHIIRDIINSNDEISQKTIDTFIEGIVVHKEYFEIYIPYLEDVLYSKVNRISKSSNAVDFSVNDKVFPPELHCGTGRNQVWGE